jgi:N-acetylmuramoyl-L-alanine amidase
MRKRNLFFTSICMGAIFSNLIPINLVDAEDVIVSSSDTVSTDLTSEIIDQSISSVDETDKSTDLEENTTSSTEMTNQTESTKNSEESDETQVTDTDYYEPSPGVHSDLNPRLFSKRAVRSPIDVVYAGETNRPAANFIDVSSHNQTITVEQYKMMRTYGVTGVVVKLTEGTSYFNPYASSQIQNAKAAGMNVSVYHYSHYTSIAGAKAEAEYFAKKTNDLGLSKSTVMISDIEEGVMNNSSLNTNTESFKSYLNSLGYSKVGYYMSRSWLDVAGGHFNTSMFGKENIWVAQYPYTPTSSQNWNNDYSAWQWSSNFYFPGISHPFDINTDYTGLFTNNKEWDSSIPVTGVTTITDSNNRETLYNATTTVNAGDYSPTAVSYAVWSEKNGQDDLIWYPAQKNSDGTWSANINIARHETDGKYIVHTYVTMNNTAKIGVASNNFTVSQPSFSVNTTSYSSKTGTFDVIVKPNTKSGVKEIRVPVWSQADRSDLIWYIAQKQADGTYKTTVNIKDHKYNTGKYTVHVYLYSNNGLVNGAVASPVDVSIPLLGQTIIKDLNGKETNYTATTTLDTNSYQGTMTVHVAVWSNNDLKWYVASKENASTYNTNIDIRNHKNSGKYYADTYIKLANGTMKCISSDTFTVSQPSFSVNTTSYSSKTGTFDVIVKPNTKSGVKEIRVPVWSQADRSDLIWYIAQKQADGTYKTTVNIKDHKYNTGKYTVHVYLYSNNGLVNGAVASPVDVSIPLLGQTIIKDLNGKETNYTATTTLDTNSYQGTMTVHVAVWSNNDLKWYVASKENASTYNTNIDIRNHKNSGKYYADTYIKLANGTMKCISSDTFTVSQPSFSVNTTSYSSKTGTFDVIVKPNTKSGVKEIRVPVWNQADRSDLIWYIAQKQADGTYKTTVNIKDHKHNTGKYTVHVYLYSNNGLVNGAVASPVDVN